MHTTAGATSPPEGEDGYRASDEGKVVRVDTVGGQDKLTKNEYCRQEKRRMEGKEKKNNYVHYVWEQHTKSVYTNWSGTLGLNTYKSIEFKTTIQV